MLTTKAKVQYRICCRFSLLGIIDGQGSVYWLQFPYLTACINEALRLYPPVPGTRRAAREDCALCGYRIPEGTTLEVMSTSTYRRIL